MGRNRYVGSWSESAYIEIDWPFDEENLVDLLKGVVNKTNQFTHQQICNWCDKHYMKYINEEKSGDEKLYGILGDISAQWDLYLTNTFSLIELQQLDFSKIKLPIVWFEDWLKELT
ncbi:hypothetical protein [Peribacillus kribbensis]|uniref:hypothetical protein n=1 Tax=Peribacillus kribbensis TaxID=356658 RepID=UPI0003FF7A07|nr:hypothetical protein [Peribacillus kribbensis]